MSGMACPRCREPFAGSVRSDWLVCQHCQHRWLPSPTQTLSAASVSVEEHPAESATELALPPAPPVSSARNAANFGSDEYAPDETGELKRRTAALTNRQGHAPELQVDPSTLLAATPVAAGTDPFDPD